jgi:very-short-patch-repair endonuclease
VYVTRSAWDAADVRGRHMPGGLRVTAPGRTVVDCARHLDLPWSLAVGDAARARWRLSRGRLMQAAAQNRYAPGHPAAVWVARLAKQEPESPLESLARAIVVLAGHPEPRCQVRVMTRDGAYRVDLLDASGTVVIEADGRIKYASRNDLWREKRREDALRDAGLEVVRFTLADYRTRMRWVEGFERAAARAAARSGSLPFML